MLQTICCPDSGQPLTPIAEDWVAAINQQIANGTIRDRLDEWVSEPIDGGFISPHGSWVHPVREGIVNLVHEDAFLLPSEFRSKHGS